MLAAVKLVQAGEKSQGFLYHPRCHPISGCGRGLCDNMHAWKRIFKADLDGPVQLRSASASQVAKFQEPC